MAVSLQFTDIFSYLLNTISLIVVVKWSLINIKHFSNINEYYIIFKFTNIVSAVSYKENVWIIFSGIPNKSKSFSLVFYYSLMLILNIKCLTREFIN